MLQVFLICVVFIFPQCKKHSHWNVWWILDKRTNVVALLGWWPFRLMCDPSPAFWARCVRAGWSVHIVLCIYVCVCVCIGVVVIWVFTNSHANRQKGTQHGTKYCGLFTGFCVTTLYGKLNIWCADCNVLLLDPIPIKSAYWCAVRISKVTKCMNN